MVAMLPYLAKQVFDLQFAVSREFVVLVNSVCGAFFSFAVVVFWEFCVKGENENKK